MIHGAFSHDILIYRREPRTDGDYDNVKPDGPPALFGFHFSHVLHNITVMPRTTANEKTAMPNAKESYTGKTLSCDPSDDIQIDDLVMYTNMAGQREVFKVEGDVINDFVSPFTGFVGGKEVFLGRFRRRG